MTPQLYCLVKDGEIVKYNFTLPCAIEDAWVVEANPSLGVFPCIGDEPAYSPETQRLSGPVYTVDGEQVNKTYTIETIPQIELDTQFNVALLDKIKVLQDKALRALIEDAPDTTYLDMYKTQIAELRAQWIRNDNV